MHSLCAVILYFTGKALATNSSMPQALLAHARPTMFYIPLVIGASLSEPHTSESNGGFFILSAVCTSFRKRKLSSFNPKHAHADPCGQNISKRTHGQIWYSNSRV